MIVEKEKEVIRTIKYNEYICDKCNKECQISLSINKIQHLRGGNDMKEFHLCHDCFEEFMGWKDDKKVSE